MSLPFENIRVIDLGRVWSGSLAARLFGDFGAEVIKIEGPTGRGETLMEDLPGGPPGERPWNRSGMFNDLNRNKKSLYLDLSMPEGKDVFKKLVAISNMVIENFSPRVMKNFGLDYTVLKEIKENIIMISMPAFGMTGPYRDFIGFGNTIEPVAGLTHLVGYADGPPHPLGMVTGDVLAGLHAAGGLMIALWHCLETGQGQYIDLSQAETATCTIGETLLAYGMNRTMPSRNGNRDPHMAPHGCYPCKGEDMWVTIAVASEEEWEAFCKIMGNPAWTKDERFANQTSPWHYQDLIDEFISQWTCQQDHYDVMYLLQKEGIACGPVLNGKEILADSHLEEREFFVEIHHPEAGTHRYAGTPIRMSQIPAELKKPAPCFGEHNDEILGNLLGFSPDEIRLLKEKKVVCDQPEEAGE